MKRPSSMSVKLIELQCVEAREAFPLPFAQWLRCTGEPRPERGPLGCGLASWKMTGNDDWLLF